MNRNRHGFIVINNTRRTRSPQKEKQLEKYIELQRRENGLQVILVMPEIESEVKELTGAGWRIMQRWNAPKLVYKERSEDAKHLQVT